MSRSKLIGKGMLYMLILCTAHFLMFLVILLNIAPLVPAFHPVITVSRLQLEVILLILWTLLGSDQKSGETICGSHDPQDQNR